MNPEFWHERWARNEIGFHQQEINAHLRNFWPRLGAAPGSLVFVPLCGKSRDLLWLTGEGHRVLGVELSPIAVEDFFAENGLTPERHPDGAFTRWSCGEVEILCGDFFDLEARHLEGIRAIYDRASLIALPSDLRVRYAKHLKAIIPPACKTLLVTIDYPPQEMQGPPFAVGEDEVRRLFEDDYAIECVAAIDALAENPRFRERGLTRMEEQVFFACVGTGLSTHASNRFETPG